MPLDLAPAPGGRRSSFRVALRMARRDINRHKGRSLLIILLIMLPVAGMTGAATLYQSTQRTAEEVVSYELGQTQARFAALPVPNADSVQDPLNDTRVASSTGNHDPSFVPADPAELLPPGYEVLAQRLVNLTTRVGAALVPLEGRVVDALHPAFAGKFTLLDGRAPRSAEEVVVSPGLLERFGLGFGEEITAGTFVPVGTVRDAGASDRNSFLFLAPEQVPDSALQQEAELPQSVSYYLVGPEPVAWSQIREANRQGVGVLSRSVVLDPPAPDERGIEGVTPRQPPSEALAFYAAAGLIAALALLEVGLLAGAAFAVGAKRQMRELALFAAAGADAPTVRMVVTAGGLWLGGIAVLSGGALGLLSAAAVVHWVSLMGSPRFPGLHPDLPLTLVSMALGLLCCVLAALAPANHVAHQGALGALKSGRAPAGSGKRSIGAGADLGGTSGRRLAGRAVSRRSGPQSRATSGGGGAADRRRCTRRRRTCAPGGMDHYCAGRADGLAPARHAAGRAGFGQEPQPYGAGRGSSARGRNPGKRRFGPRGQPAGRNAREPFLERAGVPDLPAAVAGTAPPARRQHPACSQG
jgi:putative ABC transport system permease protein